MLRSNNIAYTDDRINLRYLQTELARIDVLLRYEVTRWQAAGQNLSDPFRGLVISDEDAQSLSSQQLGMSWGQSVSLPEDLEEEYNNLYESSQRQVDEIIQYAETEEVVLRLRHLQEVFKLDPFDLDTLLICIAPSLDLRYERIYGYLQDDVTLKRPSADLILKLLCADTETRMEMIRRFSDSSPLFSYRILERVVKAGTNTPILGQPLQIDPSIVSWLMGSYHPRVELNGHVLLFENGIDEEIRLMSAHHSKQVKQAAQTAKGSSIQPILGFMGTDAAGKQSAARLYASRLKRPLLMIDLRNAIVSGSQAAGILHLFLRDARLLEAIPYITGWEACLTSIEGSPAQDEEQMAGKASLARAPAAGCLSEILSHPGTLIISSEIPWQATNIERETPIFWFEFRVPPLQQRLALWKYQLEHVSAVDRQVEPHELELLAAQFSLTSGQVRDAAVTARDRALQEGRPLVITDLFHAARVHSNPNLGLLARKIDARYVWSDIVLPEDQLTMLREIVATVRGRPRVLEEWGVGKKLVASFGIPILFSGPPGTGKTMSAEVIANELGLDLYKIDLSGVVSKYIGETEKNLERIFNEAENSNAILFFDEADAIFGKRSEVKDAHDRYANIEISYLLQKMERYDGVTILATNLRSNLDEAFTRRLQFVVDFPFPEEDYRLQIWQTLFPATVPMASNVDFTLLANRFKLAGGNIRNAIVNAAYLAAADGQQVSMEHLMHSIRRELQKMGRLVNEKDMALKP